LQEQQIVKELAKRNMSLGGRGKKGSRIQETFHFDAKVAEESDSSKDSVYKVRKILNSQLFKENEDFREKARTEKIRIENAYTQVMRAADREIPKPKPPEGKYDVILADPPWNYYNGAVRGSPEGHYAVMTDDELKALKIPAADNSVLYMWATMPKLKEALSVMETWGFDYKTGAGWEKDKIGTGYYFRGQFELLLLGVKGKGLGVPAEADRPSSVIHAPRTEHSKKPSEVYEMIESMFPQRKYIELFARGSDKREGWKTWGMEASST
jgi:N6-adenosine-specific RNA methylase IME4